MFDDLIKSVAVVTVWLEKLHTLALHFGGSVMSPVALGPMLAEALWFFLFAFGLTVGRFK